MGIGSREDYEYLARLSAEKGIAFETLAHRFERGQRGLKLTRRSRTREDRYDNQGGWITGPQAALLLSCTASALTHISASRRLRNGGRPGETPAGRGWLYRKDEIERVQIIRTEIGVGILTASRILKAIEEGRIR